MIDPADGPVIGSLGEHVGNRFDDQFDLVLSNPPWTSLSGKHKNRSRPIYTLSARLLWSVKANPDGA